MSIEQISNILEWLPHAAFMVNDEGEVVAANAALKRLFPNWQRGVHFTSLTRDPDLLQAFRDLLVEGGSKQLELVLTGDHDRYFTVNLQAGVENDGDVFICFNFNEVTEAKEAEKMRSAFIANVSHELRSPLTTLMGALNAVDTLVSRSGHKDEQLARFLGIMTRESTRMTQLINDLLSLSKTESREHIRPTDPLDIKEIVKQTSEMLSLRAMERSIKIKSDVPESLPQVIGDQNEVQQVIYNLTENAIKYGAMDNEVTIAVKVERQKSLISEHGVLELSVHNWGEAIPSLHLPRLTERFYRMQDHRAREVGGTGLGLAIVKHIVSRHHGQLLIESSDEDGTCFRFQLPLMGDD